MVRKTYAARGLLDFKMAINAGGAIIRLCFSGGAMGANGVISAKYTTDNAAVIKLIEKSPQFLSKRIYVYHEEKIKEEDEVSIKEKEEESVGQADKESGVIPL